MAGIDDSHDLAADTRANGRYTQLCALSPDELEAAFMPESERLTDRFQLTDHSSKIAIPLQLVGVDIPEGLDGCPVRRSRILLEAHDATPQSLWVWQVSAETGSSVLRLQDAVSGEVVHAFLLEPGEASQPFSLPVGTGSE